MFAMIMLCSKTYATAKNMKVFLEYYNTIKVAGLRDMKL